MNQHSHGYSFDGRMKMSQGISQDKRFQNILINEIPGSIDVKKSTNSEDRNGTDWWVILKNGQKISVDLKARIEDCRNFRDGSGSVKDDLALEIWSVVERKIIGWTLDETKQTDYVLWFWLDTGRFVLLPFRMLLRVFKDNYSFWYKIYEHSQQITKWIDGTIYHSECIFVPRLIIWRSIYYVFGGNRIKEISS